MVKIFGYGSLIDKSSLRKTVPSARNIKPAKLYGFVRVFNFPSPYRMSEIDGTPCSVLNVEKSEWNQYINGIVFEISTSEFGELLKREEGYEMIKTEVKFYGNEQTSIVFFFRATHFEAYNYKFDSKKQKEYLDICYKGCKQFGEDFLEDFRKTTFIGEKTLKELDL